MLTAISRATGREIAELVRELVDAWADVEIRKATLVARLLRGEGSDGNAGESAP